MAAERARAGDPESCFIAPSGTAFCAPSVREGVLPTMLREIIETRAMVRRRLVEAIRGAAVAVAAAVAVPLLLPLPCCRTVHVPLTVHPPPPPPSR